MNKTTIHIVCIIVLIGAMMVTPASAKTWYVHDGESIYDYTGYNGAHWGEVSSGDTIFIYNGTNYGPFNIDKPNINVIGEGADVVTVVYPGSGEIRMPNSNGDATGSVLDGIKVVNTDNGIKVGDIAPSSNCIVRNCVFDGITANPKMESSNNTFMNNVFLSVGGASGICIHGTNCTFRDNLVLNATGGYSAMDICGEYNIIANNTIQGSIGAGITLDYDDGNNIITQNNLILNDYAGIELYYAGEGNQIYLNNFIDNGVTVVLTDGSIPVTYWNSTEPITYTYNPTFENYLGNYWGSDYTGVDGDGDGIGDTSYMVPDGLGYDYHPLVEPFENYPEPAPQPDLEFGDAPDPTYPSNLSSDGARHNETDTECLGLNISGTDWKDFELDANVPNADLFDDGLLTFALTTNNPAQTVDFEVTNNITDDTLLVNILLDLNQNSVWDPGEHVVQNQPINLFGPADGVFTSTAFSTVGATEGATWMRVTLTRESINTGWNGTMASAGYAEPFGCGETEDWLVEMVAATPPEVPAMTPLGFVMVMFSLFGLVVFATRKVK
jgi:parallel beta-helix repeat protein